MANNAVVALLVVVIGLTMVTASVFNGSYSIALGKTDAGSSSDGGGSSDSGSSGGSSGNEKGSGDSGSNSGSNDNNDGNSPGSGQPSKLKEATPSEPKGVDTTPPTEESKKTIEQPVCMIPEGCGSNSNPGPAKPPLTPIAPPKEGGVPDHECLFKPELPKCASDNGKCPDGFSQNGDGNCFPNHDRCPKGFHSHEDDETGRCVSDKVPCEPGFIRDPSFPTCNSKTSVCRDHPQTKGCNSDNEDAGRCLSGRELRQDFCIRVILTIHHSGSSGSSSNSNSPNHSISDKCFSQIKIAWLAKIQRGQNSQVDSIINKCLGIHS